MTDQNVFEGSEQTPAPASSSAPPAISIPDPVKEFVGEGKKYATVEEALKSIPHAQKHIQNLQQAHDAVKAEAERLKAERETYEAFMRQQREEMHQSQPSALGAPEVETIVQRTLQQQRLEEQARSNLALVNTTLSTTFGDKAKEVFEAKAKELGVDLNALARQSPQAVLEFFKKPKEATPSVAGTLNLAALAQQARPADHKPIMFGSTTEELVAAWQRARPQ